MKVLVAGGAGYIGSHMLKALHITGYETVTLDNLSTGFRDSVHYGDFVHGDLADSDLLRKLFSEEKFDGVFHFASSSQVGESVYNPREYYRNNVINTVNLLDAMLDADVDKFIFSSSAAVYGKPVYIPIDEKHPTQPISPYGKSKLMVETILSDYYKAYNLRSVCLRYFNAAGADSAGELGELHEPETHLIPLILQAASGRREDITIYGLDCGTPDGTCVRDYVHVEDLCAAHLLAWNHLLSGGMPEVFNLGSGQGFSVKEVVDVARRVSKQLFTVREGLRREGDPDVLVATAEKVRMDLGWSPLRSDLELIVTDAWSWEKKQALERRV